MANKFDISYNPSFCDEVVRLGQEGKSDTQMAAALGINFNKFQKWVRDPEIPEFKEAVLLGLTYSLAYHEDVLLKISKGIYAKGNSSSQQFLLKNQFKEKYKDETTVNNNDTTKYLTDEELDKAIQVYLERRNIGDKIDVKI